MTEDVKSHLRSSSNVVVGKGTVAGRALQKHSTRTGSWFEGKAFAGDHAKNAESARRIIADLLERGGTSEGSHPTFGAVIKIRFTNGAGAWWKKTGEFIGFLEPYTPRAST